MAVQFFLSHHTILFPPVFFVNASPPSCCDGLTKDPNSSSLSWYENISLYYKLGQSMTSQNSFHIWFLQRLWVTLIPLNGPDCQKVVYEAIHKSPRTEANTSLPQNRLRGPGLDFCRNIEIKRQSIYNCNATLVIRLRNYLCKIQFTYMDAVVMRH